MMEDSLLNNSTKLIAIGMIGTLSACGGSGSDPIDSPPQEIFDIQTGSPAPTYDPNTGILFRNSAAIASASDNVVASRDNASVTNNGSTVFQARSESSDVFAISYADANGDSGAIVGRRDVPDLPNGGRATFTGGYAGISSRIAGGSGISAAVTGLSNVTVDLDSMRVNGSITDRQVVTGGGVPFVPNITAADATLVETTLTDDGRFNGSISGGQFIRPGSTFTPSGGSYDGLLGGQFGDQVAGTLVLTHSRDDGLVFEERGVFVAD